MRLDIRAKQQDILHALTKRPLTNADVFLFNMPCSFGEIKDCCYTAIEGIKDGYATSMKYHTTPVQFKTPNVVVVFSNELPIANRLSKDRWCVFDINAKGNLETVNAVKGCDYVKRVEEAKRRGAFDKK